VPAAPIVAGIVLSSSAGARVAPRTPPFTPLQPTTTRAAVPPVPGGSGTLVALVTRPTTMRAAPAGRRLASVSRHTEFGSPEAMWVVKLAPGWLGVVSPVAGNGRLGWIPRSSASLSRVSWQIDVSLSARRLTVMDDGKVLQRYTVAIGVPGAPTPTGRFAVTDRLETGDPTGPYGCCILALSARSPHAIQGWSGGNRIAIHSTTDAGSIGLPASHGCLRVTLAEGRWLMNHVPLGTPTLINA
jgi:lipoprotein-anchoring transpeptidase ErfK/SrfK